MTDFSLPGAAFVLQTTDRRVQRIVHAHCNCKYMVEFDIGGVFEHADLQLAHITPTWCLCAEHTERWKDTAPSCGCYSTEHVSCGGHYVDVTHHRCVAHDLVMQLERFIVDERKQRRERIRTMRAIAGYTVPCDIRAEQLLFDTGRIGAIPLFELGGCSHCKLVRYLEVDVTVVTHASLHMSNRLQRVPCIAPVVPCARCGAATAVTATRVYCVDAVGHQLCKECQPEPNANFMPTTSALLFPHDCSELHYVTHKVQVSAASVLCSHCNTPNQLKLTCSVVSHASGVAEQLLKRVPGITPILSCIACQREEPATPFQLFYDNGGYRYQMFCSACTERKNNNKRSSVAQQLADLQ